MVIFMPPAVEPGAPPMSISTILTNATPGVKNPVPSRQENPAVRENAERQKALNKDKLLPLSKLRSSVRRVPTERRMVVVQRTTLE